MITLEIAQTLRHRQEVHHITAKNADDKTPLRAFVTGRCKTWKGRPGHFRVPIKRGLWEHGEITQTNCADWKLP